MLRSEKVATPATAATGLVPDSVPPPGFEFAGISMLTFPVKLVAVFPRASWAATWTAGVIAAPAVVMLGCMVNKSCAAAPGVIGNAALVPVVTPVAAAVSV